MLHYLFAHDRSLSHRKNIGGRGGKGSPVKSASKTGKVSLLTGKPIKSKSKKKPGKFDIESAKTVIAAQQVKIEKLKLQKEKVEKNILASIKFPVPDEEITTKDPKGKKPVSIPPPLSKVSVPDAVASVRFSYHMRHVIRLKTF